MHIFIHHIHHHLLYLRLSIFCMQDQPLILPLCVAVEHVSWIKMQKKEIIFFLNFLFFTCLCVKCGSSQFTTQSIVSFYLFLMNPRQTTYPWGFLHNKGNSTGYHRKKWKPCKHYLEHHLSCTKVTFLTHLFPLLF